MCNVIASFNERPTSLVRIATFDSTAEMHHFKSLAMGAQLVGLVPKEVRVFDVSASTPEFWEGLKADVLEVIPALEPESPGIIVSATDHDGELLREVSDLPNVADKVLGFGYS